MSLSLHYSKTLREFMAVLFLPLTRYNVWNCIFIIRILIHAQISGGLVPSFVTLKHLQLLDEIGRNFSTRDQGQKKAFNSHLPNLLTFFFLSADLETGRQEQGQIWPVQWLESWWTPCHSTTQFSQGQEVMCPARPPSSDEGPGLSRIAVTLYSGCLPRMLGPSHFLKKKCLNEIEYQKKINLIL